MHIAFVTHEYPPDTGWGGIGTYTFQMANLLAGAGHHVEVFSASLERNVSEVVQSVYTHRVKVENVADFKFKIVETFCKQQKIEPFDIIECPEIGGEAELIKNEFPDIPLLVRLHTPAVLVTRLQNTYVPFMNKLRFVLGSIIRGRFDLGFWSSHDKNQKMDPDFLITENADMITAPSMAMKEWACKFWKIKENRIRVISNPFSPSQEFLDIPMDSDTRTITFYGRLNILKGMVALSKAIPVVLKKHSDWKFRMIGSDEESPVRGVRMREWMQNKLKKYVSQIEWVDWVKNDELPNCLANTEIVVVPSLFESFSYVCAEAMSAGRAVVGSRNGGMRELIGESGILVSPKSHRQISKAIIYLIENPKKRIEMGNSARARIQKYFAGGLISEQTIALYEDIIEAKQLNTNLVI